VEAVRDSATNVIPKGAILVVVRSGILARIVPVAIAGRELTINQDLKALCPTNRLDKRFLYYFLQAKMAELVAMVTRSATVHRLATSALTSLRIPLPSLAEQKRIVGIVDEALAAIDKAKANTERNIENARALFESHVVSVFTEGRKTWEDTPLSQLAQVSTGPFGTMLHKSDYVDGGIPLVNPINIVNGRIVPASTKTVTETTAEHLSSYRLRAGDVVVARRGELGRCAVVGKVEENWLCGTGSFFIRFENGFEPRFFATYFASRSVRERLIANSVGTTMESLNHGILNVLPVPTPPEDEQRRFLANIDQVLAQSMALEQQYESKVESLEALKKSLLDRAFAGNL
jgi:type I restriction enzyme S subunit